MNWIWFCIGPGSQFITASLRFLHLVSKGIGFAKIVDAVIHSRNRVRFVFCYGVQLPVIDADWKFFCLFGSNTIRATHFVCAVSIILCPSILSIPAFSNSFVFRPARYGADCTGSCDFPIFRSSAWLQRNTPGDHPVSIGSQIAWMKTLLSILYTLLILALSCANLPILFLNHRFERRDVVSVDSRIFVGLYCSAETS